MPSPEIIALVPARHHSQRVPGKNYRQLGNKPLYEYVIDTLLQVAEIQRIYIDTDSQVINSGITKKYPHQKDRLQVLMRPPELCQPNISMNKIITSILNRVSASPETIILQTHVTNPFLSLSTVERSLDLFQNHESEPETLLTATKIQKRLWNLRGQPVNHEPGELLQTQDLEPLYEENSCLYIFRRQVIDQYQNRLGKRRLFFPITSHVEAWDIDTEEDFQMAQIILKHREELQQRTFQDDSSSEGDSINQELYQTLQQALQPEMTQYFESFTQDSPQPRILISAPYMMSDAETFRYFYENELNCQVTIAKVNERLTPSELELYHGKYDIALIGDDHYNRDVLHQCGAKSLCKWGTGIDSIDQDTCRELGISVYNTPGAFTIPVTQSMMAAIFGFLRQTFQSNQTMKNTDRWVKLKGRTIDEVTVGIIGLGNIGSKLSELLVPFNPAGLLGNDILEELPHQLPTELNRTDLKTLLQKSDIVCLCCTLTPSSHHIINQDTLSIMKPGSYLINMARGPLIKEEDLIPALQSGHIQGVAMDVFEDEPLPISTPLRSMPNVILSSHNANSSSKYWTNVHINTIRNSIRAISEQL